MRAHVPANVAGRRDMNYSFSCVVIKQVGDREIFTEEIWDLNQDEPKDFILLVLHIIIFFTGVPLNTFIILRIITKKLHSQPTYMLLLNLAISDLLICLIPVLFNIICGFLGSYSLGSSDFLRCQVCKVAVIYIILNFQTVLNLSLISLDRLAYFKLSIKYHQYVRTDRVGVALVVVWVASILLGLPPLGGYGDVVFSTACGMIFVTPIHVERSISYIVIGILIHSVGIAILVVTNAWIVYIAWKQIRSLRVKPVPKLEGSYFERRMSIIDVDSTVKQFKLFQVFGGILLVHFVTLIPAIVLVGIVLFSGRIPRAFYTFVLFSLIAQATLHPLVEAFFTPELKKVIKTWCQKCRKRPPPDYSDE